MRRWQSWSGKAFQGWRLNKTCLLIKGQLCKQWDPTQLPGRASAKAWRLEWNDLDLLDLLILILRTHPMRPSSPPPPPRKQACVISYTWALGKALSPGSIPQAWFPGRRQSCTVLALLTLPPRAETQAMRRVSSSLSSTSYLPWEGPTSAKGSPSCSYREEPVDSFLMPFDKSPTSLNIFSSPSRFTHTPAPTMPCLSPTTPFLPSQVPKLPGLLPAIWLSCECYIF